MRVSVMSSGQRLQHLKACACYNIQWSLVIRLPTSWQPGNKKWFRCSPHKSKWITCRTNFDRFLPLANVSIMSDVKYKSNFQHLTTFLRTRIDLFRHVFCHWANSVLSPTQDIDIFWVNDHIVLLGLPVWSYLDGTFDYRHQWELKYSFGI